MKVAFYTLGCKVNSYETEAIQELFQDNGYEIVDFDSYSDVYIINSCMVTNTGERKSKKYIRRPLQHNPDAIILVMGCLSQMKAEEILSIEGVKIVLGTKNRDRILQYLDEYLNERIPLNKVEILENRETYDNLFISDFKNHQRAFLKIQDGCNNFCFYCIIPYSRGRIRSKAKNRVLQEARQLVDSGHVEIVLTGIHTGGYGQDLQNYSFADLLRDLETVEGLKRIRISSIEISELDDEVIDVISTSKKIVNHLHIPLQSGSDRILKLMNRKYTSEEYIKTINILKDRIPNLAITTDIIVGFPSETEADFQEQLKVIETVNFQELHVFPFSKREGTVASRMKNQIPGDVKKERVNRLLRMSEKLKDTHIKSQLGRPHQVIPEQVKDGYLQGHTRDYILVRIEAEKDLIGTLVDVVLTSFDGTYCYGKIQTKNPD
ncbi:MAG: tRNA (N(6)-L-threonylcarbamoyladenosine(37)-C(2))-methylthiotransferase MtaB [Bacilli bacterium]|nr:tRNA (N(6)-L-threonylcarbamoyladenosine(37)-C(2))-methylthiotransferase MtaB [Bacilli bacterium]MBN2877924.1 tRNA (N(6)-L-threonylcarbamoyladenosine(37)-C(2))-methylthiotransferase MtaB [Bacilli bacterium]